MKVFQSTLNLVIHVLFHVNAERLPEVAPKKVRSGDSALSLMQKPKRAGKIFVTEDESQASLLDVELLQIMDKGPNVDLLEVEPQWFTDKVQKLQIEAKNQTFFHDKCNAGTDPHKKAMDDSRQEHAKCRMEEKAVKGANVTDSCRDEKKKTCDKMQVFFEESYCDHAANKQAYCSEFESCHAAADAAWAVAEKHVERLGGHLHRLFILRARLECQVAAWPVTANSKCENLSPDTSHLKVTYPEKPTPNPCVHPVTPVPGDSSWSGAEYSDKPWKDLVRPVQACTTTMTTTSQASLSCTPLKTSTLPWTVEHRPPEYSSKWRFENAKTLAPPEYVAPDRQGSSYSRGGDPSFFWVIDVGASACIKELRIANGHGGGTGSTDPVGDGYASHYHVKDYKVGVSDDPKSFPNMKLGHFPFYDRTAWQAISLGTKGRYIRMDMTTYGKNSAGIAGIEVEGSVNQAL